MSRMLLASTAILLMTQFAGMALGFDRKGRLIEESSMTRVSQNDAGKLAIGGDTLRIKDTMDGSLLSISIDGVPHYLAYPTDKDASPALKLVKEPGPGCHWVVRRVPTGRTKILTILEMDIFEVKDGAIKGYKLIHDKNKLLILSSKLATGENYVGRTYEYDNLDDGK